MGGIKGVGEGVVEAIIQERTSKGPFRSLFDFCSRIDTKKIGKKTIENLVEAGCFDFTGVNRQTMIMSLEEMYQSAMQKQKEVAKGFIDLFRRERRSRSCYCRAGSNTSFQAAHAPA